jgi:hypothetical protein
VDEEEKNEPQKNVMRSPKIAITPSLCEPLALEPQPHASRANASNPPIREVTPPPPLLFGNYSSRQSQPSDSSSGS